MYIHAFTFCMYLLLHTCAQEVSPTHNAKIKSSVSNVSSATPPPQTSKSVSIELLTHIQFIV